MLEQVQAVYSTALAKYKTLATWQVVDDATWLGMCVVPTALPHLVDKSRICTYCKYIHVLEHEYEYAISQVDKVVTWIAYKGVISYDRLKAE